MPNFANDNPSPCSVSANHKYWEEGCLAAIEGEAVDKNPYASIDRTKARLWLIGHNYCQSGHR